MKLLNVAIMLIFAIMTAGAHAQVTEDSGLPSGGENTTPPVVGEPPPVSNPGEFNQDIDDFEKKISKEVPPSSGKPAAPAAAGKAHDSMKKLHDSAESEGGNGIAARKAAKKSGSGASASAGKKGKADKKGKKADKKKGGKKSADKKSDKKSAKKKKKSAN